MMFSARRPSLFVIGFSNFSTRATVSVHSRASGNPGGPTIRDAALGPRLRVACAGTNGGCCTLRAISLRRAQLGAYLVEHLLHLGALEAGDVVLIFEQHAERVGNGRDR